MPLKEAGRVASDSLASDGPSGVERWEDKVKLV